jgi:hypothetical protein
MPSMPPACQCWHGEIELYAGAQDEAHFLGRLKLSKVSCMLDPAGSFLPSTAALGTAQVTFLILYLDALLYIS